MTVPLSSLTDTWNDGSTVFAAIQMSVTNTASDPASKLLDLKVGGVSKFSVGLDGSVVSAVPLGQPKLLGNTTFYVNADTGNDANAGTSGSPFATLVHAWDVMCSYALNGFAATIQLQDSVAPYGPLSSGLNPPSTNTVNVPSGNGGIVIQGNATDPSKTVVASTATIAAAFSFFSSFPQIVTLRDLTTQCVTNFSAGVYVNAAVHIIIGDTGHKFVFGGGSGNYTYGLQCYRGQAEFKGDITVNFNTPQQSFVDAEQEAYVSMSPNSLTLTNVVDYTGGGFFYEVIDGAILALGASFYTGTIAGPSYFVARGAILNGKANGLPPGASAGTMSADGFNKILLSGVPFANLPRASGACRLAITDGLSPVFGNPAAGGGTVFTPVIWNGSAWIVG